MTVAAPGSALASRERRLYDAISSFDSVIVAFSGGVEGRTKDGANEKLAVTEGEMAFDIARGRPQSILMIGALESQPIPDDLIFDDGFEGPQ